MKFGRRIKSTSLHYSSDPDLRFLPLDNLKSFVITLTLTQIKMILNLGEMLLQGQEFNMNSNLSMLEKSSPLTGVFSLKLRQAKWASARRGNKLNRMDKLRYDSQ